MVRPSGFEPLAFCSGGISRQEMVLFAGLPHIDIGRAKSLQVKGLHVFDRQMLASLNNASIRGWAQKWAQSSCRNEGADGLGSPVSLSNRILGCALIVNPQNPQNHERRQSAYDSVRLTTRRGACDDPGRHQHLFQRSRPCKIRDA